MYSDPFSISPLITLLPVSGDIRKLSEYSTALYTRFEQVVQLREQAQSTTHITKDPYSNPLSSGADCELTQLSQEEAMLRVVLDWLAMK